MIAHRRRLRFVIAASLVAALVGASSLTGCKAKAGDACELTKTGVCGDGLLCADPEASGARCMTQEDANKSCAKRDNCIADGHCTVIPGFPTGGCEIGSDADCKQSSECKRTGDCTLVDHMCAPTSDADCKQSENCAKKNECTHGVVGSKHMCRDVSPGFVPSPQPPG